MLCQTSRYQGQWQDFFVITCSCPWCLLLAQHSSNIKQWWMSYMTKDGISSQSLNVFYVPMWISFGGMSQSYLFQCSHAILNRKQHPCNIITEIQLGVFKCCTHKAPKAHLPITHPKPYLFFILKMRDRVRDRERGGTQLMILFSSIKARWF